MEIGARCGWAQLFSQSCVRRKFFGGEGSTTQCGARTNEHYGRNGAGHSTSGIRRPNYPSTCLRSIAIYTNCTTRSTAGPTSPLSFSSYLALEFNLSRTPARRCTVNHSSIKCNLTSACIYNHLVWYLEATSTPSYLFTWYVGVLLLNCLFLSGLTPSSHATCCTVVLRLHQNPHSCNQTSISNNTLECLHLQTYLDA